MLTCDLSVVANLLVDLICGNADSTEWSIYTKSFHSYQLALSHERA